MCVESKGENGMANVLVINFPGEGHINPTIAVVNELIRRGKQLYHIVLKITKTRLKQQALNFDRLRIFFRKLILWNELMRVVVL